MTHRFRLFLLGEHLVSFSQVEAVNQLKGFLIAWIFSLSQIDYKMIAVWNPESYPSLTYQYCSTDCWPTPSVWACKSSPRSVIPSIFKLPKFKLSTTLHASTTIHRTFAYRQAPDAHELSAGLASVYGLINKDKFHHLNTYCVWLTRLESQFRSSYVWLHMRHSRHHMMHMAYIFSVRRQYHCERAPFWIANLLQCKIYLCASLKSRWSANNQTPSLLPIQSARDSFAPVYSWFNQKVKKLWISKNGKKIHLFNWIISTSNAVSICQIDGDPAVNSIRSVRSIKRRG